MTVAYKAYHTMRLPDNTKVPVKDHGLMAGREFSITGDIAAAGVTFHGDEDVSLSAEIVPESVTLEKMNPEAVAGEIDYDTPEDPRLATAGAVIEYVGLAEPEAIPAAAIDALFDD